MPEQVKQKSKLANTLTSILFAILCIVIMIGGIGFWVYYSKNEANAVRYRNTIADLNNRNTSLQLQLDTVNNQYTDALKQLAVKQAEAGTYTSQISADQSKVSSLQKQLDDFGVKYSSLQDQILLGNKKLTDLQNKLDDANTQMADLQKTIFADKAQINSLQNQVAALTGQLQIYQNYQYANSANTVQLVNNLVVTQSPSQQSSVLSFTAGKGGNLYVTGFSTSTTAFLKMTNSSYNTAGTYTFGTTDSTITIPIQPGSISVSVGNSDVQSYNGTFTVGTITNTIDSIVYTQY